MKMSEIDKKLRETEVKQRRKALMYKLKRLGVYQSRDGRKLEDLSLYELEWLHIEEKNNELREEVEFD